MTAPSPEFTDLNKADGAPSYDSRVIRLMARDDVASLFLGTFDVADNRLYTFRPSELRWLSEKISDRRTMEDALRYRLPERDQRTACRAPYDLGAELAWFDFATSVPRISVREMSSTRIVVRASDVVPNFSIFRARKPLAITLLDLVAVLWFAWFSYWAMGVYAAFAILMSFIALRESANRILRSFLRRERITRLPSWAGPSTLRRRLG